MRIAKVCIDSFLYFHPNAKINVHADEETFELCSKRFKTNNVCVSLDCAYKDTWQVSKLKLALKLSGTKEILIDADLKWNGPIGELSAPTYFVREFTFQQNSNYLIIFKTLGWKDYLNYSMKNTSFLSLTGLEISTETSTNVLKRISEFENAVHASILSDQEKIGLIRIAEQVALSLLFDDNECDFLKSTDKQFDGSLVESSYFGATGTRFGILGATSK